MKPKTGALDREIRAVLAASACSGCGACCLLDTGLTMQLDGGGFLRPVRRAGSIDASSPSDADAARRFRSICPGVRVTAPVGTVPRHPVLGPVLGSWRAWATDPAIRRAGSSGGALTALTAWLATTGETTAPVACRADSADPRRTVTVTLTTRAEALASAGSRYAPVATAAAPDAMDPSRTVVAKPCEATALRRLAVTDDRVSPLLLSFFCAGTPSQDATNALVEELGIPSGTPLSALRYRGDGWPGRFAATSESGQTVSASYDESWGKHLGPTVQWRCKICPDGVGESSDITAGDLWTTDSRGYPTFVEGDGVSALLARTPRGLDVIQRAVAAGVLRVEAVDPDEIAAVQPLQRGRRRTLLGRLVGARLAGRRVPRIRGFGLLGQAVHDPRATVRAARGTFRRIRSTTSRTASADPAAPEGDHERALP